MKEKKYRQEIGLKHRLNPDCIKEFSNLKDMIDLVDGNSVTFKDFLATLKEFPRKTYQERAMMYEYSLNGERMNIVDLINYNVREINEGVKTGRIQMYRIKFLVNEIYKLAYDRKAF